MKILVTGAAGFIGFHLCEALLLAGHKVIGIDNINDYYDQSLKLARLKQLGVAATLDNEEVVKSATHKNFAFIKLDIGDNAQLTALFQQQKFAIVINLAAQAGVRYSIENPAAYVQANIVGFHKILENSLKYNIKHLIYASSSSIYGFNDKVPFSEQDQVDYPVSMYAATKKSSELMAHTYSHLHKLPTTGLRFFTVYGPWGRPDMAPYLFTKAILAGQPIKVFNHGDLFRDFTYISDIIEGITGLINKGPLLKPGTDTPYAIFNIGNAAPVNLMEFIAVTEKYTGKKAIKVNHPMQPGDVYKTYADISALKGHTGYQPSTGIEEGMKSFVDWYKDYHNVD